MGELTTLLTALNSMTPLAVIALLGLIIFLMIHKRGPIQTIANNHLSHVQDSLDRIEKNGEDQLRVLGEINSGISYLQGRLNGRAK